MLNTIPAQEIKRRGIAAVDDLIVKGPVHIIRNNQPQYVVMTRQRYEDLIDAEDEAFETRLLASLEDLRAGRVRRFSSAAEILHAIDNEDDL